MSITINGTEAHLLGVQSVQLDLASLSVGVASLSTDAPYDADGIFSYGEQVRIAVGGVSAFVGRVRATPRQGEPQREGVSYTLRDLWHDLDQITFTHGWSQLGASEDSASYVFSSRAPLYRAADGSPVDTAAMLGALVAYAASKGVAVQLGSLPAGVQVWPSDLLDRTVGQLLREVMRWHPDQTSWIDYTTTPVTLHFATATEPYTVDASGVANVESVQVRSREDLQLSSVGVFYERSHSVDGNNRREIVSDIYPEGSDPGGENGVAVTVPIQGANVTTQTSRIRTVSIPQDDGSANGVSGRLWWRRHFPKLEAVANAADLVFEGSSIDFTEQEPAAPEPEPLVEGATPLRPPEATPSDFDKELLDGGLEEWMGVKSRGVTVKAKAFFKGNYEALNEAQRKEIDKAFPLRLADSEGTLYPATELLVAVEGTDANKSRYTRTTSFSAAENPPEGIAQHLYEVTQSLHWEGAVTLVDEDIPTKPILGRRLQMTGGRTEWLSMDARVQQVSYDLHYGETRVRFGAPEHLAPQDMIQLLQVVRAQPLGQFGFPNDEKDTGAQDSYGAYVTPKSSTSEVSPLLSYPDFYVTRAGDKVFVYPGRLQVHHVTGGVSQVAVKVAGSTLSDQPLALTGSGSLVLQLDTDSNGIPTAAEVKFGTEPQRSHRPAGTNGVSDPGQDGLYQWTLAEVSAGAVNRQRASSVDWSPWLSVANVGAGAQVYKDRSGQGQQRLRTLVAAAAAEGSEGEIPVQLTIVQEAEVLKFSAQLQQEDLPTPPTVTDATLVFQQDGAEVARIVMENGRITEMTNGTIELASGGIPEGFSEYDADICDNGIVSGKILFKPNS